MMLTASNNVSLAFCQSVVEPLCLGFLSCFPFVPMVMNLFSRDVHTILHLRCLLVTSVSSFSTLLDYFVFFLCVTAWSHISLQKHLLSSASGLTLSLCASPNSLNNLFWFHSNNRFCLHCFVLLSYLSSFAPTTTNLCRTSLWTTFTSLWTSFKLWYYALILQLSSSHSL